MDSHGLNKKNYFNIRIIRFVEGMSLKSFQYPFYFNTGHVKKNTSDSEELNNLSAI